jgi:chromosome segregation ATPase
MQSVVTIWFLLLLAGVAALAGLALPRDVRRPRDVSAWLAGNARRRREAAEHEAAEAAEQIRYAEEIAVAARGAQSTADRRRAECRHAQQRVTDTWQAYERADAALTRARRAAAYAVLDAIELPERRRALRRAAEAAHRRGDLSDEQLLDALTHRNGWDPALHPVEQELVVARAAVRHRFALYQQAMDAEADAWRASDVATAAVRSLRVEAASAAARADRARATLRAGERAPSFRRRVPAHA